MYIVYSAKYFFLGSLYPQRIGVGRFKILGGGEEGARFRIWGGGGQVGQILSRHLTSC